MNIPILDPRSRDKLMELLADRIREYTPEWRYEPGATDDPGAALTELFGEMFYQTIDRFNQIPRKTYVEFLNLLGVSSPTVTPASGFLQFHVGGTSGEPVRVAAGTEAFAKSESGENIVFETERGIDAVSAVLEDIYYVDAKGGRIEEVNLPGVFFAPSGGENLQRHRFAISQNEVLSLEGPCTIEVEPKQNAGFLEEETARRLADADFASWKYFSGGVYRSFEEVSASYGVVKLEKNSLERMEADEDGRICVYCDISEDGDGEINLSGIRIKSIQAEATPVDSLANNDIPISPTEGGYCFGRRPVAYELFYIRSDDVFVKRGADVALNLDMSIITYAAVSTDPQYEFNRNIIEKDGATIPLDEVYVEQVAWEYYNGSGWAMLSVVGNRNPFSGKTDGELRFTVPRDMSDALVNAERGYYIRARVVNVENFLSTRPMWLLPLVREVRCRYSYAESVDADYVCSQGNGEFREVVNAASEHDLGFVAYQPIIPHPRAMYLRFDSSPHAIPLSMFFDIGGEVLLHSKVSFEAWVKDRFVQARSIDDTQNLRYTGAVFLYLTEPLTETRFFGKDGYWIRMSLSSGLEKEERPIRVSEIFLNCVNAVQRRKALAQYFNTGAYDAGKTIELLDVPVLDCVVRVDERNGIGAKELERLMEESPELVSTELGVDDSERHWIKWERVASIARAGFGDRVYELDSYSGEITFGKGPNGKVPPRGDLNIRVNYSYGGGVWGNLGEGEVNALIGSIPRIRRVSNITPMSGGTDRPPMEKIEQMGNKRIRHRFVPMSLADFEEITLERFERAALVKCFAATDGAGNTAPGHICLVVMGRDMDERMTAGLCREIYNYLAPRADCNLVSSGRLHVVPSMVMTVNVETRVLLADLDAAALTQQAITENISALINGVWRTRGIGEQIDMNELYQTVKSTPNVVVINRILPEGRYRVGGAEYLTALDDETALPFATVRDGIHTVHIG